MTRTLLVGDEPRDIVFAGAGNRAFITTAHRGQHRSFGYLHDGSIDTLFHFVSTVLFAPTPEVGFPVENPDATRRDVEQFILAFDTDLAPIVGQQITLTATDGPAVAPRIDLLKARAAASFTSKALGGTVTECDLLAKAVIAGHRKGFLYKPSTDAFALANGGAQIPDAVLRALAAIPGQEVTYTCVPPGSGSRVAQTP